MNKTVAVVFGGRSAEHDISIITGQFIMSALETLGRYHVVPIYIAKNGLWYSDPSLKELKTFQDPQFDKKLLSKRLPQKLTDGRFVLTEKARVGRARATTIDVVFPALHGTYGEDGSLMGLLRLTNTPFVGCDLDASAVAMDKVLTKVVTAAAGIPSVPFVWFSADQWQHGWEDIAAKLKRLSKPWFVKPAHLGSSIAISKVETEKQLGHAIEVALHYDDKVIVEQGVSDLMEVNCAILGNGTELTASLLEQPLTSTEFLDFENKYIGAGKKGGSMSGAKSATTIPAPLAEKQTAMIQQMAKEAFIAIGGSGTARLDFLIDQKTGKVYLNEINPLPGSLQQHLWRASGVSNIELVDRLIELAIERFEKKQKLTTYFSSSVLNQGGGTKNLI